MVTLLLTLVKFGNKESKHKIAAKCWSSSIISTAQELRRVFRQMVILSEEQTFNRRSIGVNQSTEDQN